MTIASFTTVLPVDDLEDAVAFWSVILGVEPTFVDGHSWAQFDADGRRIALAGADRFTDTPSLMLKAVDLEATRSALLERGAQPSEIAEGAHERRFTATVPGGWTVAVYGPKGE